MRNLFKKDNYLSILLAIILVIGIILRFYQLEAFPVGFHLDEASKGYSAYSLLHTGKDDNNNVLPLYIDIFGDNSPAGYHYLTIIPISLFGLSEFAVRLPGAFFGALSIIAAYFLSYAIFNNKRIGLLSAALLSISPWHINLSRASSESLVSLFFIMSGFALVIGSLQTKKFKPLLLGTTLLGISFFIYQTPRLFVPMMYLSLVVFYFKNRKLSLTSLFNKILLTSFVILCVLDLSLIFLLSGGVGRFNQVNIFNFPEMKLKLEEQIREDGVSHTPVLLTRAFHNKLINSPFLYATNYLEYFSWTFLFMKGLPPWYFVPNMGVLYFVELPFVVIGAVFLILHKNKLYKIPLLWLLLGPVAAASAIDTNNLQRAIVMFIVLEIIAACGIFYIFTKIKRKKFRVYTLSTISLLFAVSVVFFLHQYFIHTKVHRTWYRYNGFEEMIKTATKTENGSGKIVITKSTGGAYPLVQFFTKYDPKMYQKEGSPKDREYSGFGRYFFVPDECPSFIRTEKYPEAEDIIYINNGKCSKDPRYKETIITREDGTRAYRIVYRDTLIEEKIFENGIPKTESNEVTLP